MWCGLTVLFLPLDMSTVAPRSFVVTSNGTLERMPAPIQAETGAAKRKASDDMKIVIPKSTSDNISARLRSTGKYQQNNTANSLNIRDYIEPHEVKRKERNELKATERISFNLHAQM